MNQKENLQQDENHDPDNRRSTRLRQPTALKRPSNLLNDNTKIPKRTNQAITTSSVKEQSILRSTTFTISSKETALNSKPPPRNPVTNRSMASRVPARAAVNRTIGPNPTGTDQNKRPTWDLKGRILDLEQFMQKRTEEYNLKVTELEGECQKLRQESEINRPKLTELERQSLELEAVNQKYKDSIASLNDECSRLRYQSEMFRKRISDLELSCEQSTNEKNNLIEQIKTFKDQFSSLERTLDHTNSELLQSQCTISHIKSERERSDESVKKLTEELAVVTHKHSTLVQENEKVTAQLQETTRKLEICLSELATLRDSHDLLMQTHLSQSEEYKNLKIAYENLLNEKYNLVENIGSEQKKISEILAENKKLKEVSEQHHTIVSDLKTRINNLQDSKESLESNLCTTGNEVYSLKKELDQCRNKLSRYEIERRTMHHRIMELRGTIRVCCRVRPTLEMEKSQQLYSIDYLTNYTFSVASKQSRDSVMGDKIDSNRYEFTFDQIFGPNCSQSDVFEEIEPLIQSALDGYSVCIFAYGQTGSGKTYTMEGCPEDPLTVGLIQRSVEKIFDQLPSMNDIGWKYSVTASFLEIYNDNIRDLLVSDSSQSEKLEIKAVYKPSDKDGRKKDSAADITITNLTTVDVSSSQEVNRLLRTANRNRTVGSTKCNQFSSRSHSVFRLKIKGVNNISSEVCEAYVNLVDLAGSERLSQSGAEGDRMKETQHINKSLTALRSVISSLCKKDSHVPFRDSKLTHLLQPSLGKNCKTLMLVNISPTEDSYPESLNSLRFASSVINCPVGMTTQKKSVISKECI